MTWMVLPVLVPSTRIAQFRYFKILTRRLVTTIMRKLISQFFLLFFIIIFFYNVTYASKARLEDIVWDKVDGNLIVSFKLNGVFSSQLNDVILNGTPVTFTFFVTLYQVRDLWLDKKIVNIKIDHMMKYDILQEKFTMKRSWRIDEVLITESFFIPLVADC